MHRIGEAAERSGVSAMMIRHYEAVGLLPAGARRANDYREAELHELRFIRHARDLGFSLVKIGDLLSLWRNKSHRSADARALAKRQLEDIERRIDTLQSMAATLDSLVEACSGDNRPDCPILTELKFRHDRTGKRTTPITSAQESASSGRSLRAGTE